MTPFYLFRGFRHGDSRIISSILTSTAAVNVDPTCEAGTTVELAEKQNCQPAWIRLQKARVASMAILFLAGFLFATWGVHVPTVQDVFALTPGQLTTALFAVAAGSVCPMFVAGPWISRLGPRLSCLLGGLLMIVGCASILQTRDYATLLPVLACFGFALSTLDIAANAEATTVEELMGRPILSSMHAMFSVGGAAGGMMGAALLALGMSPKTHMLVAAGLSFAILASSLPLFLPKENVSRDESHGSSRHRWRSRPLWMLGFLAFLALCAEGGIYDWAVIYMRDTLNAPEAMARYAYAAFAGGIAVGRFLGDMLRRKVGASKLVCFSAIVATFAIIVALVSHIASISLVGFAILGLGIANVMPVLFAASTKVVNVAASDGLTHVAGLAYFGLLAGPVVIGAINQLMTLSAGLMVVAICTCLIAIIGPRMIRQLRL